MISFPSNSGIARKIQSFGVDAQLVALFDAREHLEIVDDDLFGEFAGLITEVDGGVRRQFPGDRCRAELASESGRQLLGLVADDVVETVVPEAENLHQLRLVVHVRLEQLLRQVENALNVIVIHVADHEQIDRK